MSMTSYRRVIKKERRLALPLIRTEDNFMLYNTHKAQVPYFGTTLFFSCNGVLRHIINLTKYMYSILHNHNVLI